MTGSNNRLLYAALALLSAAAFSPATAQTPAAPLLLTPPPSAPMAPDKALPAETPPGAMPSVPTDQSSPTIAVAPLAPPATDAMGLVDARSGGFAETLWQSTRVDAAQALIARLPRRYVSLSAQRLAQQFLLSAVSPPATDAPAEAPGNGLLEARVNALAAMADWNDALALVELVPAEGRPPALRHLKADASLMTGKVDQACGEAQSALKDAPDDAAWQKVQVLCQFTTGQRAAASLAIGVLHEQDLNDPAFFWAADMVQGTGGAVPAAVTAPNAAIAPVVLALLRQANNLPSAVVESADPGALMIGAQMAAKGTPDEAHVALIERAVAAGVTEIAVLRTAYAAMPVDAAADSGHIAIDTSRQRAATYQLAVAQTVPVAKAEVIARAWDLVRPQGGKPAPVSAMVLARTYAPMVQDMSPSADLGWFAGTAARILIGARGDAGSETSASLRAWLDLAAGMSATASEVSAVNDKLWPYRQLLTGGKVGEAAWQSWRATLDPAAATAASSDLLALLTALGDDIGGAVWQPVLADSAAPQATPSAGVTPTQWYGATAAARSRHVGEAVALALALLGEGGDALAVDKALETLVAVGREGDARAIAADLALAHGL